VSETVRSIEVLGLSTKNTVLDLPCLMGTSAVRDICNLCAIGCYRVLSGAIGCYRVLSGAIGCYRVLYMLVVLVGPRSVPTTLGNDRLGPLWVLNAACILMFFFDG
jgi:hypothetical protein